MMIDMDWWTRLARTNPESAAWLYLRELFESDHTHGFDDFVEDDGFMRLRADAKWPGARVRWALTMEVLAKTPEDALALADRAGRAAVRMVEKGLAPNLAAARLVYRERHWMEEDL